MLVVKNIHRVINANIFTIVIDGIEQRFYLQKHFVKNFGKYLEKGVFVSFDCQPTTSKHRKAIVYKINFFKKIWVTKKSGRTKVLYELKEIRKGIKDLVNQMNPILFIDFEMNMQDFKAIPNFVQEIIEAGVVITDQNGQVFGTYHWYIKPTKYERLTHRALKFLHYTNEEIKKAINFKVFYNEFKQLIQKYNPYVVVWGKSDITQFKKTCAINEVKELDLHFVNLLQLHTNYFNLKDSPGLFHQWEVYNNEKLPEQKHDSLEDAKVTCDVFFNFKEKINNDFKNKLK